jgi:hypothetical protein
MPYLRPDIPRHSVRLMEVYTGYRGSTMRDVFLCVLRGMQDVEYEDGSWYVD